MVSADAGHIILINFMDNLNNREMICNEKSIIQVSVKLDITLIHYMNSFVMVTNAVNRYRRLCIARSHAA